MFMLYNAEQIINAFLFSSHFRW